MPSRKHKRWTDEEETVLAECWGSVSIPGLARKLGRSENAIKVRANRMRLGAYLESGNCAPLNQVYQALNGGVNRGGGSLDCWIRAGLPFRMKKVRRSHFKVIDMEEFWTWAEEHKGLFDFSKLEKNTLGPEPDWVNEKRRIDQAKAKQIVATPWTPEDDSKLRCMLHEYRYTYDEIAAALHRTEGAVKRRLSTLGIRERPLRRDPKPWTDDEVRQLIELHARGYTPDAIGRVLGRSGLCVRGKIERIANPEYMRRDYRNGRCDAHKWKKPGQFLELPAAPGEF